MTSKEYAERTRISSILRSIMLDSSPGPTFPMNSSAVNQDFNILEMAPRLLPCTHPPRPLPPWLTPCPESGESVIHFLDFASNPGQHLNAQTAKFMHVRLRPRPPRLPNFRARLPVADDEFNGVDKVHLVLLIGCVCELLTAQIWPENLPLCYCYR